MSVTTQRQGNVFTVILDRPAQRNAVDGPTARALADAFREFDADSELAVAVLWGAGGTFCAGADLKALSEEPSRANALNNDMTADGPMGPSRMQLSKPVIAAIEGHAVAGGLELACWADMRVAAEDAVLGVFCRRFGVPLIDGGTLRLPRLIGMSRAMDLILTGRAVDAAEALQMGLVNRLAPAGQARQAAEALAAEIAAFPQHCLRNDRLSAYQQWGLDEPAALANEFRLGMEVIQSGETLAGATAFSSGKGRGGSFES
jgi:enoyl-CoA hydratase